MTQRKKEVLLIGTGRMARDYIKVLRALRVTPIAVGRSKKSTAAFEKDTGIPVQSGGISAFKKTRGVIPPSAIIAVSAENLSAVAKEVISAGCRRILLEKPGGLALKDIQSVSRAAKKKGVQVFIGYNRRFYSSIVKAKKYIKDDGGAISFSFSFYERLLQKEKLKKLGISPKAQKRWFIVNAIHVIDTAFYLGGLPQKIAGFTAAGPLWAPHPTLFSGAGMTHGNIPFYYEANWELEGPWSVEVGTKKRKLILAPLETLKVEKDGVIRDSVLNDSFDARFKPGLYHQTKAFLEMRHDLPTLEEHIANFPWFEKIERGTL